MPGQSEPIDVRQSGHTIRSGAVTPRMNDRDILAFHWIGEQAAASADNLQELLARPDMRELLGSLAGGTTKEAEKLSASRIRHIIEDRWAQAGMVNYGMMMGKKWVWLTRRALHNAGLPFSPHRPAEFWLNRMHHVNRVRLYLERLYGSANLPGRWESECWYGRHKQEWRVKKKEEPGVSVPDVYRMWHTPAGIWTFRDEGATDDSSSIIEVEVGAKGSRDLEFMLRELAACEGTVWYFVEMDPEKGVFSDLMENFEKLEVRYKSRFSFYDLAEPYRLVYHFER